MSVVIRYTCRRELLPMVEGALAANGYRVDISRRHGANGSTTLIMSRGLTIILLTDLPHQALAGIDVWGMGQATAAELLESLPIELHKHSSASLAAW